MLTLSPETTSPKHLTLQDVGRGVAEVQALVGVGRQLLRRVGRREHHHAGARDLVDDVERHRRRCGTDDGVDTLTELAVDGLRADGRVLGVAGVALGHADRLAECATGGVDVLDREADAGDLGRAERREAAGDRQERADLQRAVAGAGAFDRDFGDVSRRRGLGRLEDGLRVVDLVVGVVLLDAVARDRRLTVAGELERAGEAVVVDVLGSRLDEGIARCVRRALRAATRDSD